MNLYHFYGRVVELWNKWELRAMILLSLLLQISLSITGSRRKYTAGAWLRIFVWLAYLSADWLAAISLGILARSQGSSESNGTTSNASFIPAFWAPMLLVHLGGPDAITAYSVEDNELWSRHLLQLLTQLSLAFYASLRSWWSKDPLIYVVIPIFVSGTIKYGERIWVLWLANSNKSRDSADEERMHLQGQIEKKIPDGEIVDMSTERIDEVLRFNNILAEAKYLHEAHFLFRTLKLLFAGYLVTFPTHMSSYHILQSKDASEAFKLIEVELGFMFDVLFTKVMTGVYWLPRFILRFIGFLSSVFALLVFSLMTRNFHAYNKSDIIISYLLLVGAIVLEVYSAILMFFSDWAVLWLTKQRSPFADSIYRVICSSRLLSFFSYNKRWKATITQFELREYQESPSKCILIFCRTSNLQSWEVVDLKNFIFDRLLKKRSRYNWQDDQKMTLVERVAQLLRSKGCLEIFTMSVVGRDFRERFQDLRSVVIERDFHETILLWHLAADRCFNQDKCDSIHCKISRFLSNYMAYLWSDLPFMLPKELGEATYTNFDTDTNYKVVTLLNSLNSLAIEGHPWSIEQKWEMISEVFLEMVTYAASNCGWKEHTRALTQGGELFTFVAILMSHLGLSQQCLYE